MVGDPVPSYAVLRNNACNSKQLHGKIGNSNSHLHLATAAEHDLVLVTAAAEAFLRYYVD